MIEDAYEDEKTGLTDKSSVSITPWDMARGDDGSIRNGKEIHAS